MFEQEIRTNMQISN
jgi:hypothetical protein